MVKSGAKSLGKIALNTGANVLGDVISGRNFKESLKSRGKEAANVATDKAINRIQTYAQTGSGKRAKVSVKKRKASTSAVRNGKKRKASTPRGRSKQTTKRKTTVKRRTLSRSNTRSNQTKNRKAAPDIFG